MQPLHAKTMNTLHLLILFCLAAFGCRAAANHPPAQYTHYTARDEVQAMSAAPVPAAAVEAAPCDEGMRFKVAWDLLVRGDYATARESAAAPQAARQSTLGRRTARAART